MKTRLIVSDVAFIVSDVAFDDIDCYQAGILWITLILLAYSCYHDTTKKDVRDIILI